MSLSYDWAFPLPRTHTGMLQGNGTFGAMIWGQKNVLCITLGRADFWDHRGGLPWSDQMNYATIRRLLEDRDEQGLRALFEQKQPAPGQPRRPSVIPIGRLELVFPDDCSLVRGSLHITTGRIDIQLRAPDARLHTLSLDLSMYDPLLCIELPQSLPRPAVRRVTSWNYVGEHLASIGFQSPAMLDREDLAGWIQTLPSDPPLCVGYRFDNHVLWVCAECGDDEKDARVEAATLLARAIEVGPDHIRTENRKWWSDFWSRVPRIEIPQENIAFLYHYGMYKFAGLTAPRGVPATLQGPWIEEYQMPPWSSDYHFNINVQMCYWPAYRGNCLSHLRPLFRMVWDWHDKLADHARKFVGIPDGFMLPHAVDDRCTNMGGFWSGTVDHGCTAWVAKMMYDYWLYGGDDGFLKHIAYPFMLGAMRVYEQMLEKRQDGPGGHRYVLPVSVSPEYRGSAMNAWGADASFQLACIHWLIEALLHTSQILGETPSQTWLDIQQKLPRACLLDAGSGFSWWENAGKSRGAPTKAQIALWQNTPLEESHRHHSHLAGLVPFDVIDADDPAWKQIVENSLRTWVLRGMGAWSGWCMPWAAMLHARAGNADMAAFVFDIWQRVFTNEGHGTLHDCQFPGYSLIGAGPTRAKPKSVEIMQMDAGMGITAAVMELLLQTRRGIHYFFPGAPGRWTNVAFDKIRTEGAFLVSARRVDGKVTEIKLHSERGGPFRLVSPWDGSLLTLETHPGDQKTLTPPT